jgi:predicted AAA+ superfamily ATPase
VVTALIHIDSEQKRLITGRARLRRTSFSQEVCKAIELYLSLSVGSELELSSLARAANRSATRTIKKLDETIAYVGCVLGHRRNSARPKRSEG